MDRRKRASLGVVAALAMLACHTREDAARSTGRRAALIATERCPADAEAFETCVDSACRVECAPFADSVVLTEACMSRCTRQGTCDSDSDCGGGLVCVMIAPVLRRCQARPDAAF